MTAGRRHGLGPGRNLPDRLVVFAGAAMRQVP